MVLVIVRNLLDIPRMKLEYSPNPEKYYLILKREVIQNKGQSIPNRERQEVRFIFIEES